MKKRIIGKKGNGFNLIEEYKKSWDYIKESGNFISAVIIIFFGFAVIGYFVPAPDFIVNQISEFIKEILEKTKEMSQYELINFIFLNNLQSSFFGMVFGLFFGLFPVIAAVVNGYLLGFVAAISIKSEGILVMWRLLPHGIFELPAVFISLGLGVRLGTFIFEKDKADSFKEYFFNSMRVFLFVIIPLLTVAAIIEGILIFVFK